MSVSSTNSASLCLADAKWLLFHTCTAMLLAFQTVSEQYKFSNLSIRWRPIYKTPSAAKNSLTVFSHIVHNQPAYFTESSLTRWAPKTASSTGSESRRRASLDEHLLTTIVTGEFLTRARYFPFIIQVSWCLYVKFYIQVRRFRLKMFTQTTWPTSVKL